MWGENQPLSVCYLYMLWKSSTFHSEVQIKMKINKNAPEIIEMLCINFDLNQ